MPFGGWYPRRPALFWREQEEERIWEGREVGRKLGGVEGRETAVGLYCMREEWKERRKFFFLTILGSFSFPQFWPSRTLVCKHCAGWTSISESIFHRTQLMTQLHDIFSYCDRFWCRIVCAAKLSLIKESKIGLFTWTQAGHMCPQQICASWSVKWNSRSWREIALQGNLDPMEEYRAKEVNSG